jgi:protein gp37
MSMRLARMAAGETAPGRKRHYLNVINEQGRWNNQIETVAEALDDPLKWKQPSTIFVNSMSDLFHENVPIEFIQRVFDVMAKATWHQFQILTKRARRLEEVAPRLPWGPNIWQGVSIENRDYEFRADHLRRTGAAVKFLSIEPLLGPIPELRTAGLDWVIVGGESGPGCRPLLVEWVRSIRDRCTADSVAFFFKQWGHIRNNPISDDPTAKENGGNAKGGRMLDGRTWDQMPRSAAGRGRSIPAASASAST